MEPNKYPIYVLNTCNTAILGEIITAGIPSCISIGLSNEIHFIDECTCVTSSAEIVSFKSNEERYAKLSSFAYCQFLWL